MFDMRKELIIATLATITLLVFYNSTEQKGDAFQEWKNQFGVSWAPEEEAYRRLIFEKKFLEIERHNADNSQTYKKGVNQFTVFTQEELTHLYLDPMLQRSPSIPNLVEEKVMKAEQDIDWSAQGKVTGVKNQGKCGSCWAFAATAVMESWSLFQGNEVDLSEQQLVDCTRSRNWGCRGGWPQYALDYAISDGMVSGKEYPYVAKDQNCSKQGGDFKIGGYNRYRDCSGLHKAIYSSPLTVEVDATNWFPYKSGVFTNCGTATNHAVLLVGFIGGNYKIKNSWGETWGQSGYITLGGPGSTCGICLSSLAIK